MFKQAVYNADKTECLEIGYFENWKGEIQIEQFKPTTKKVPSVLPEEITSLKSVFQTNTSMINWQTEWDTKNITDMSYAFYNTTWINEKSIAKWNTSKVTNISSMFSNAYTFNQPIGKWDTSKVKNMSAMFFQASNFNQDISIWNTSNVFDMSYMFYGAENFNQDLSNWNTSNVWKWSQRINVSNTNWKKQYWPKFTKTTS
ncbi:BspA family leucine-rich repeat surface protein [Mycoplasma capricolum]|uniref:BspA family leucine-rich repeat surface protein n=1 Tax=Mycoplasma capricolum TaxID=2095 RepID=UPI003DA4D56A